MPLSQAPPYPPWPTSYWLLLPYLLTLIYLLLGIQSRASCVVDKHFTTELRTNRRAGLHVFLTHVVFEHTWFWDPLEPRWFKRMNSLGFVVWLTDWEWECWGHGFSSLHLNWAAQNHLLTRAFWCPLLVSEGTCPYPQPHHLKLHLKRFSLFR